MSLNSTPPIGTEVTANRPAAESPNADRAGLRQAAEAFEALFLQTLLRQMREAQLEEGFFGKGAGASGYEALFEDLMSRQAAGSGALGIANLLEGQWSHGGAQLAEVERLSDGFSWSFDLGALPQPAASGYPTQPEGPSEPDTRKLRTTVSGFGIRRDPIHGLPRFHSGVDLPAPVGTPVLAVAPGRVSAVEQHPAYGLNVVVAHAEGWTTRYAHLSAADVQVGQSLTRGQTLGKVGESGRTTGPHLHFEAARGGRRVDPALAAPGRLETQVLGRVTDK